jgi:hypothetical protein
MVVAFDQKNLQHRTSEIIFFSKYNGFSESSEDQIQKNLQHGTFEIIFFRNTNGFSESSEDQINIWKTFPSVKKCLSVKEKLKKNFTPHHTMPKHLKLMRSSKGIANMRVF